MKNIINTIDSNGTKGKCHTNKDELIVVIIKSIEEL